jgi:hypothetical protein
MSPVLGGVGLTCTVPPATRTADGQPKSPPTSPTHSPPQTRTGKWRRRRALPPFGAALPTVRSPLTPVLQPPSLLAGPTMLQYDQNTATNEWFSAPAPQAAAAQGALLLSLSLSLSRARARALYHRCERLDTNACQTPTDVLRTTRRPEVSRRLFLQRLAGRRGAHHVLVRPARGEVCRPR